MLMNGADAILRSLEAEGVDVDVRHPGRRDPADLRRARARHDRPARPRPPRAGRGAHGRRATRAPRAASASPSPPPGPGATNLVTPIADAWMDSTPLVCITGQVRSHLIGTDAFQECDITGITIPIVKHSWLVQDVRRARRTRSRRRSTSPAPGAAARSSSTSPRDVQEAEIDFSYPDEVDLPGWRPPRKVHPRQIREAAQAIADAPRARPLRRRRHAQRRRLRRAARARRGCGGSRWSRR